VLGRPVGEDRLDVGDELVEVFWTGPPPGAVDGFDAAATGWVWTAPGATLEPGLYGIDARLNAGGGVENEREAKDEIPGRVKMRAQDSDEPPETLRARVTSKGGTTYAPLSAMEQDGVKQQFMRAMQAARQRARELGDEFGSN